MIQDFNEEMDGIKNRLKTEKRKEQNERAVRSKQNQNYQQMMLSRLTSSGGNGSDCQLQRKITVTQLKSEKA